MSRRRRRYGRRGLAVKCALGALALVALLVGGYRLGRSLETRGAREAAPEAESQSVGKAREVEYLGATYRERTDQTLLLLMGIDRGENSQSYGARRGGQADFLLLLLIDHEDRSVRPLQIERDTIANVVTLGVLGNPTGTKQMQICLSHGFGDGGEQSCGYTVEAVENLLQGIDCDGYLALELNAIETLNDALGGVTLTLETDFTQYDPAMWQGATLTLRGKQAEYYLRQRMDVDDGTNAARMLRHKTYLAAASQALRACAARDKGFINRFFSEVMPIVTTDLSQGRLINEFNRAYYYDILPVETLTGEYSIGEDGFVEFHADEAELEAWVIRNLYKPK